MFTNSVNSIIISNSLMDYNDAIHGGAISFNQTNQLKIINLTL